MPAVTPIAAPKPAARPAAATAPPTPPTFPNDTMEASEESAAQDPILNPAVLVLAYRSFLSATAASLQSAAQPKAAYLSINEQGGSRNISLDATIDPNNIPKVISGGGIVDGRFASEKLSVDPTTGASHWQGIGLDDDLAFTFDSKTNSLRADGTIDKVGTHLTFRAQPTNGGMDISAKGRLGDTDYRLSSSMTDMKPGAQPNETVGQITYSGSLGNKRIVIPMSGTAQLTAHHVPGQIDATYDLTGQSTVGRVQSTLTASSRLGQGS